MELQDKTAVITGGASGIGRAIAASCLAAGANVVIADVERNRLEETLAAFAAPDRTLGVTCDVSVAAQVTDLREAALARFGAVHLVCNNAGVGAGGPMSALTTEDWSWVLGVNLWGVIHGVSTFLPLLLDQGEGHIVNTASVAGILSYPQMGPYNVSKHGVVTLTETLFHELAQDNSPVGVSVLCPGLVKTGILDSERNRPETLRAPLIPAEPTEEDEFRRSFVTELYEQALDPTVVGDQVVDAVRSGRFWIFTDDVFAEAATARHQDIQEARNPTWRGHLVEEQLRFGPGAGPGDQ